MDKDRRVCLEMSRPVIVIPGASPTHTDNTPTVVPVMNGHPRDQAKVSVHCRWPLVTGTDGQAGDAKYNTPCNTT